MKAKSEVIKDYTGEENVWNNARDFRPKHMQRCLCYDKYMGGVYCYVYDDIDKYWCTQTTEEHDPDGDNHICDYADYRVTVWMCLPKTTFYPKMQGEQILANSAKTCKIENYQEEGWYSSGDDEYICGISFDEPIKLPVEFYYKKKEVNNEVENTKKEHPKKVRRKAVKKSNTYERGC